ncbi:ACT domain-containing protein [bacterium]|nr:ACT domain-containing protein [Mariniblastus sp.]MDA7870665.1 ACT domain-containing protein [bacterium]MDA7904688.1 ACT domain-containing protein [bacterium]MDA7905653.1 ACT domain-containing protein [Mariniblastus sp.]MDA7926319.1 ACT domain-containing protein [Mariniblastus sp.]
MKLQFLETTYSVCQLAANTSIPDWANSYMAVIRTDDETTIITATDAVPKTVKAEHDFACFRVTGKLEFDVIGVIAAISQILAEAEIPILSVSTYNTDYFLIANANLDLARLSLRRAGYEILN